MDTGELRNSNRALVSLVVAAIAIVGLMNLPETYDVPPQLFLGCASVFALGYILTLTFYVLAKGYSGIIAIGLLFLSALGVLIAAMLPDRDNNRYAESTSSDSVSTSALNSIRILVLLVVSSGLLFLKAGIRHVT